MKKKQFKEKQYDILNQTLKKHSISKFGLMVNESWNNDPKRTVFTLSRYKFVSKIFDGLDNVLEIGCADAFGTRIVQQSVNRMTAIDFDQIFIDDIKERYNKNWPLRFFKHDILKSSVKGKFDGVFSLDVLEHINPKNENKFIINSIKSLKKNGIMLTGMPSLESQTYASPQSKKGHVNCKSGNEFKQLFKKYFHNVFLFSMNDEVVHTGYNKMAHYLMLLCTNKK